MGKFLYRCSLAISFIQLGGGLIQLGVPLASKATTIDIHHLLCLKFYEGVYLLMQGPYINVKMHIVDHLQVLLKLIKFTNSLLWSPSL